MQRYGNGHNGPEACINIRKWGSPVVGSNLDNSEMPGVQRSFLYGENGSTRDERQHFRHTWGSPRRGSDVTPTHTPPNPRFQNSAMPVYDSFDRPTNGERSFLYGTSISTRHGRWHVPGSPPRRGSVPPSPQFQSVVQRMANSMRVASPGDYSMSPGQRRQWLEARRMMTRPFVPVPSPSTALVLYPKSASDPSHHFMPAPTPEAAYIPYSRPRSPSPSRHPDSRRWDKPHQRSPSRSRSRRSDADHDHHRSRQTLRSKSRSTHAKHQHRSSHQKSTRMVRSDQHRRGRSRTKSYPSSGRRRVRSHTPRRDHHSPARHSHRDRTQSRGRRHSNSPHRNRDSPSRRARRDLTIVADTHRSDHHVKRMSKTKRNGEADGTADGVDWRHHHYHHHFLHHED